jgi:hypothetical protein
MNITRLKLAGVAIAASMTAMVIVLSCAIGSKDTRASRYIQHIDGMQPQEAGEEGRFADGLFAVGPEFSSHLPLLAIDAEPTYGNATSFVSVYNNGGINRVIGGPTMRAEAHIERERAEPGRSKSDYRLRFAAGSGLENGAGPLGMGLGDEWALKGMAADKSLLRDYIAYTLAAEVMPHTPKALFCELLLKTGGGYRYEGVYLLVEDAKECFCQGDADYLLRRSLSARGGEALDTWATREKITAGHLEVLYPARGDLTEAQTEKIAADVSEAEKTLYSEDPEIFLEYPDLIDVDSFVDYFLLNEFFMNYNSGIFSAHMYKNSDGKLCMGPLWKFEDAADNMARYSADPDKILFPLSPWYERLVKNTDFVKKTINRWRALSRSVLAPDNVERMIDQTVSYLGDSLERERSRWGNARAAKYALRDFDPAKNMAIGTALGLKMNLAGGDIPAGAGVEEKNAAYAATRRQTDTYEQEIIRLRYLLRRHASKMSMLMPSLMKNNDEMIDATDDISFNSSLALGYILLFIGSIRVARKAMK